MSQNTSCEDGGDMRGHDARAAANHYDYCMTRWSVQFMSRECH